MIIMVMKHLCKCEYVSVIKGAQTKQRKKTSPQEGASVLLEVWKCGSEGRLICLVIGGFEAVNELVSIFTLWNSL